jgi:hypothetical protein
MNRPFSKTRIVASLTDRPPDEYQVHRTELDSHADTSACGESSLMVEDSGTYVTIGDFGQVLRVPSQGSNLHTSHSL